jgi:hypothetical protein
MGSLYQQKGRDGQRSGPWWIKYYVSGVPRRESTGTTNREQARRLLKEREGRVATGQPILPRADRIRYEEVAEDLRKHYEATGSRNLEEAGWRLTHLDAFFTGRRIASLGPTEATASVLKRQGQGAANGTINRELAVLNRMLRVAYESGKLVRLPVIRQLKEAARAKASSKPSPSRPCVGDSPRISRWSSRCSIHTAGAIRAKCSPWSAVSSIWRRARCGSIRGRRRTTRAAWSTSRRNSRRC